MSRLPFDQWKPQEPPPDFLSRVDHALDAQATSTPSPLRRRALLVGLAAAATAATWVNYNLTRRALQGTLLASTRIELEVAPGVIAIAEPGAHLSYQNGQISQHQGEVAYQTQPNAHLHLKTPTATAEGQGACCRVKVLPSPDPDLETSGPATVLALFQGSLALQNTGRTEHLSPHQYALSYGTSIRTDRQDRSGAIARALSLPPPITSASTTTSAATSAASPSTSVAPPPTSVKSATIVSQSKSTPAPSASVPPPIASTIPSARPFIVPRCICLPGDAFCACPE